MNSSRPEGFFMILLGLEVLSTTVNFALIISNVNYGVLLDNKI